MKIIVGLVCLVVTLSFYSEAQINNPSILVISGGGARGAWGAGVAKHLTIAENKNYTIAIGTSTGSLMGPLVLLHKFDTLEKWDPLESTCRHASLSIL